MKAIEFLFEGKITLNDLYQGNLPGRDEIFWDEVSSSELNKPFTISKLSNHKLKIMLLSQYRVEHIDELFDLLDDDQKEIIEKYSKDPELTNKIIVVSGDRIIDGNHRALAAAIKNLPINYIDLSDDETLNELYDPESSFKLEYDDTFGPKELHARAYDRQGNYIDINFVPVKPNVTDIEFSRNDSFDVTGGGDASRVFATVLEATRRYLQGYRPPVLAFSGKSGSRSKLYKRLVDRFAAQVGYAPMDLTKHRDKVDKILSGGDNVFVLRDVSKRMQEASVSGPGATHTWNKKAPLYRQLVELEDELYEGWKDWVAGAAMGAAALAGSPADAKPTQVQKPAIIKPEKKAPESYNLLSNNPENELALIKAAKRAGMNKTEMAQFLAQTKHESWDFERLKEKPQPGVKGYFTKKYDPKYAPKTAKILGNKHVGDGEKYHGRGFIQLTGRDNYRMASQALGIDLIKHPELAARRDIAAAIAVWYWNTRVKPYVNNFADTSSVTKKINPAAKGLQDRHENFQDYMRIL